MKKISFIFFILTIISLSVANDVYAITVRIDQPKVRLSIARGGEKSGIISIENPSDITAVVRVYIEDWQYSSTADGSKDFFPPGTTPLSCAKWITFAPAELNIPPYGKQTVSYTASCPADAQGGHFAVLFFETALGESQDEQGVSVAVMGRLGSLFVIEPEGSVVRDAQLQNLKVQGNVHSTEGSAEDLAISLDLKNTGNIDIATEGTFYLMDGQGLIVARGEFSPLYTLPGDAGVLSSTAPKKSSSQIPAGAYDLVITIDLGGVPKTVEAKLNVDSAGKILYSNP